LSWVLCPSPPTSTLPNIKSLKRARLYSAPWRHRYSSHWACWAQRRFRLNGLKSPQMPRSTKPYISTPPAKKRTENSSQSGQCTTTPSPS